ncbi:MAG TPA: hypothetical protein VK831_00985, partial [Candidatus Deferrimicrobiaceae bacterium]|nr:hypothetical protein [Candidatus Deferrimicrobiaceae bacterium]
MTTTHPADRPIEATLPDLQERAPESLGFGALVEVGLADRYAPIQTPLGRAYVAWNGRGVSWLSADEADDFATRFTSQVGRPIRRADTLPDRLGRSIERRLAGDRRARVPLDLRGHSPFEVAVWTKALEIPRGEVRPYAWVAAEIGRP